VANLEGGEVTEAPEADADAAVGVAAEVEAKARTSLRRLRRIQQLLHHRLLHNLRPQGEGHEEAGPKGPGGVMAVRQLKSIG